MEINNNEIKKIGLKLAIFLSYLKSKEEIAIERRLLKQDGFFEITNKEIVNDLGLSLKTATRRINELEEMELIERDIRFANARFIKILN